MLTSITSNISILSQERCGIARVASWKRTVTLCLNLWWIVSRIHPMPFSQNSFSWDPTAQDQTRGVTSCQFAQQCMFAYDAAYCVPLNICKCPSLSTPSKHSAYIRTYTCTSKEPTKLTFAVLHAHSLAQSLAHSLSLIPSLAHSVAHSLFRLLAH